MESTIGCAAAAAKDSARMRNGNRRIELRERVTVRVLKRDKRLEMAVEDSNDDDEYILDGIDASFRA